MKQIGILGVVILLLLPATGCICYPGYSNGCYTTNNCAVPFGCGSVLHQGVVDYVDGGPGATEADCGAACGTGCYSGGYTGCGPCTPHGVTNCGSCLGVIGDGIRVIGEGAFTLAATPFIFLGHIITGGGCGYETYPNCGCSNEVYYGDNCYQQHDFCDPCAGGCDPCGGGASVATSGCSRCNNGYTEGIQYEDSAPNRNTQARTVNQTYSQPTRTPTPVRTARTQVNQMSYRRPVQQPAQRIAPPQQRIAQQQPMQPQPPRPQVVAKEELPVLPQQ